MMCSTVDRRDGVVTRGGRRALYAVELVESESDRSGTEALFVRYQAAAPNRHGRHPGVFALVNGLAWSGTLTAQQQRFRRRENDWFEENLVDPGQLVPSPYDSTRYPRSEAWFKSSAVQFISRVQSYLAILDAHGIEWIRLASDRPGRIVYDDPFQIVVDGWLQS